LYRSGGSLQQVANAENAAVGYRASERVGSRRGNDFRILKPTPIDKGDRIDLRGARLLLEKMI